MSRYLVRRPPLTPRLSDDATVPDGAASARLASLGGFSSDRISPDERDVPVHRPGPCDVPGGARSVSPTEPPVRRLPIFRNLDPSASPTD